LIHAGYTLATFQIVIEGLHTAQALVRFEPPGPTPAGSRSACTQIIVRTAEANTDVRND